MELAASNPDWEISFEPFEPSISPISVTVSPNEEVGDGNIAHYCLEQIRLTLSNNGISV